MGDFWFPYFFIYLFFFASLGTGDVILLRLLRVNNMN